MSQDDLNQISDFLSSSAQNFILQRISRKEINDLDINVQLSYKDELDVDITVDLSLDDLSTSNLDIADEAIEYSLDILETYLDENFRIS